LSRFCRDFSAQSRIASHYRVTPFDSGMKMLKSDKYLQLVEAAQLDFLVKTKLFVQLVRSGTAFVNVAQLVKFMKPIRLFERVRVESAVVCTDERCAYFSHVLFVGDRTCAEVLVKMKFKRGSVTVSPVDILGSNASGKPPHIERWDQTLEAM